MGLISRFSPWGMLGAQSPLATVSPTPFAPNQPPEGSGRPTPPMSMSAPNKPPAQGPGFGGFMERLTALPNNGLFQIGMSLWGNARNGGDPAQVLRDMQSFQDRRQRQQLIDNQMRRQKVMEGREDQTWESQQERRRLAQEYIASRPEAEQAELRMIDPDALGGHIQQNRQIGLQERGMDLQLARMDQDARQHRDSMALGYSRMNMDRMLNSASMVLGREEAARLGGDIERLRGWSLIDNDLAALEEILDRNEDAFNNLFDADVEQALARIRDPQDRRDVQTIYSIATNMAREELRGQTPVSNIDMLAAVRGAPSPSSGSRFARDWLNRAYQDRQDLEQYVQGAINYMQQPDGSRRTLFEPDPATGRNFYQSDTFLRYTDRDNFSEVAGRNGQGGGSGRQTDEQRAAQRALEQRQKAGRLDNYGTVGGRAGAPRLLREPRTILERQVLSEYSTALERGQTGRAQNLERRLRRAGMIP